MMHQPNKTMQIAVCLKQVPDTTELRIDPETNTLIREGVEAVLNPLDEFALESGLRLRDEMGGELTVFTMGPKQAQHVLDKGISMGADYAVLLCDRSFAGADTWATSLTIARALERAGQFDLVLCGKQAIDGDTGQVGPGIAAHLGVPQVTYVTDILPAAGDENAVEVKRLLDNGTSRIRVQLPAVLTVLKEANEPRFPSLGGRLRALETSPTTYTTEHLDLPPAETGLDGSPTRVVSIDVPQLDRRRELIQAPPQEAAQTVVNRLRSDGLLD